jgi:hypothetical protein
MPKGLDYIINVKDGNFGGVGRAKTEVQGLDDVVDRTGRNLNGLGGIARSVGGIIAGAFAISTITSFATASEQAYRGMLMADAQVRTAITSTSGIAGRSLEQLKAQADALENTTMFDADMTAGAQSLLLTFTNIRGGIFDQAIPAIQDMAQRMAGDGPADLKGASIQVGKALNDPIKGITALSRVGVSFTEQQKQTIEQMVKTGDTAGAQALILKELNTEFGGSAAAARQAAGGKQDLFVATEQLKEGIGSLMSTGLEPFYGIMTSVVTVIGENISLIATLGLEIGAAIGIYALATAGIGIYTAYQTASAAATGGMTIAQWALNAAMNANPVGLIITGIAVLVGGLTIAYQKSETFRAGLSGVLSVAKLLGSTFLNLGKTIIGALTLDKNMFLEGVKGYASGVQEIMSGGIARAFEKGYTDKLSQEKFEAGYQKSLEANKKSTVNSFASKDTTNPAAILPGTQSKADSTTVGGTGTAGRNVMVTINRLVENLTVNTTNLQGQGSADIKRLIEEILVGAVHDSELALS